VSNSGANLQGTGSTIVRVTPQHTVGPSGQAGGAFGIALAGSDDEVRFAAVDDINNSLEVWIVH